MYRMAPYLFLTILAFVATMGYAQEPSESPLYKEASIPALVVGAEYPKSFMAHGRLFTDNGKGLAFQITADGKKQRCIFYDPKDGTPIFISDGEQVLIYDLENTRLVRWKGGVGKIWLDWNVSDGKQFNLDGQILRSDAPIEQKDFQSGIALDKLVFTNEKKIMKQSGVNGVSRFIFQHEDRTITIEKSSGDKSWFQFTATEGDTRVLELEVRYIGTSLPTGALILPNMAELAKSITVVEIDNTTAESRIPQFFTGRVLVPKLGLALGSEKEEALKEFDWNKLRTRDTKLGAQYRDALTKQGIRFTGVKQTLKPQ